MRCCGVPKRTDPELYLRLAFERTLLSEGSRNPMLEGFEGAVISRVLTAAGALDRDTAQRVLEEYQLAKALRQEGPRRHMLLHARPLPQAQRQPFSSERVAMCDIEFEHGNEPWMLGRVLFGEHTTRLDLLGARPPGKRGNPRRHQLMHVGPPAHHPHPQTLTLADDQGTTATAHAGQASWSDMSWEASYTSDAPLSPDTQWIEIDGSRLELPDRQPGPEVRVEEIEPIDPLRAALYREILSTDRHHGGRDTVEIASKALIATGALGEDDAMLSELRRIADAMTSATPVPGLLEPWASLMARYSKGDGTSGTVAIGAVIDDLEGFSIRIDSLASEPGSFSISLAISPGTPLLRHFPGMGGEPSPITWWAEDDRMNAYVAFSDRGGGGPDVAEGQVTSLAPLDPKATELRLLPTGIHSRAIVTVPLGALAGAR
jgi:hypothetical protein